MADVTAKVLICVAIVITLAQLVIDLLYFLLPIEPVNIFNLVINAQRATTVFWSAVAAETVVLFVVVVAFFVVVVAFFVVVVGFFVVVVVAFVVVVVLALVVVVFFVVVVVGFWVVVVIEQFKAIG